MSASPIHLIVHDVYAKVVRKLCKSRPKGMQTSSKSNETTFESCATIINKPRAKVVLVRKLYKSRPKVMTTLFISYVKAIQTPRVNVVQQLCKRRHKVMQLSSNNFEKVG